MLQDITFITAHFRDFEWTQLLVESICQKTPADSIREIIIIDQDRSEESRSYLQTLGSKIRVVQYPKSEPHFLITQHDHSAVLNAAVKEARGELILIFDSDAHPISMDYLEIIEEKLQTYDAILAEEPTRPGLTHPCFMVLRQRHIDLNLAFDQDLFTKEVDTGRLIGQQLREAGEKVYLCSPKSAFNGDHGTIYLESVYHHGHGSFKKNESEILQKQVNWENAFFRQYVIKNKSYSLPFITFVIFRIVKYIRVFPIKVRAGMDKLQRLFRIQGESRTIGHF